MQSYDQVIDTIMGKYPDFNGVLMLGNVKGKGVTKASGIAERVFGVKVNTKTRFGIASGTKGFTAIKILQLIESGKVSLGTSLNAILPGVFKHVPNTVTLRHILMHMSGMPDYFDEDNEVFSDLWKERPMYTVDTIETVLEMFRDKEMIGEPGLEFKYNNGAFIALGAVIEALTGIGYDKSIEASVFGTAQMKTAGFDRLDQPRENTAVGYIFDESNPVWKSNIYALPVKGLADGGVFLNAQDMAQFWKTLSDGSFASGSVLELLDKHHVHVSKNIYYSLGFWTKRDDQGLECIYLMGEDPGVSFMSVFYPKTGYYYVLLSNTESGVWDLHFDLYDKVLEMK